MNIKLPIILSAIAIISLSCTKSNEVSRQTEVNKSISQSAAPKLNEKNPQPSQQLTVTNEGTTATYGSESAGDTLPEPAKNETKENQKVQFICNDSFDKGTGARLPTTFAWAERGKIAVVRWKTEEFAGYSPQKRCDEVSPRFQEAYDRGTLKMITNGKVNGQPVICTATEYRGKCETLLMTLRSTDDSIKILNSFKDILNGRGAGPILHNSGFPQVYYQVDIETFLRTAPVEGE
jgi:Circadian oscillating protein COP23